MLSNTQKEILRDRFGVRNGQMRTPYRFKNLNWYYNDEWFAFADISDEDVERLVGLLLVGEILTFGWKDMQPNQKNDQMFGDGGGLWLELTNEGVTFDKRLANERIQ